MAINSAITVLVVDDQGLLRETLCEVLAKELDIEVVGGIADSETAIRIAAEKRPDVILLDGPDAGGIVSMLAEMKRVSPNSRCIVLTSCNHPALVREALRLRVSAFLAKNVMREEVITAIRSVVVHPDQIVLSLPTESLVAARDQDGPRLSARELQIIENVAQGMSNGQIASRLEITEATVKRHLRNIFDKLGAVSRIDAVNKAKSVLIVAPPRGRSGPPAPRAGAFSVPSWS
ncbi:response regulator transcription factor [Streptomyces sp. NPDC050617]|uniref:response regulator transcription factor n=1 Tax=Streptomyces sp. NPDC050617 TaxID=3154628 RepID=UPI0034495D84